MNDNGLAGQAGETAARDGLACEATDTFVIPRM